MPNVMAAQPNIGGALCESSVIPLFVPRHKVWLTAAALVPCSKSQIPLRYPARGLDRELVCNLLATY